MRSRPSNNAVHSAVLPMGTHSLLSEVMKWINSGQFESSHLADMLWEAVPRALLPRIHKPKQRLTRGESLSQVTGYVTRSKVKQSISLFSFENILNHKGSEESRGCRGPHRLSSAVAVLDPVQVNHTE